MWAYIKSLVGYDDGNLLQREEKKLLDEQISVAKRIAIVGNLEDINEIIVRDISNLMIPLKPIEIRSENFSKKMLSLKELGDRGKENKSFMIFRNIGVPLYVLDCHLLQKYTTYIVTTPQISHLKIIFSY